VLANSAIGKSLCLSCAWMRLITSGTGSQFYLCRKSQEDPRFAKYPPQPIVKCSGYQLQSPVDSPAAGNQDSKGD
jgi:hypothetical protein